MAAAGDALIINDNSEFDQTTTVGGPWHNMLINIGGSTPGQLFVLVKSMWCAAATGNGVYITGLSTPLTTFDWGVGESFSNGGFGFKVDNGAVAANKVLVANTVTYHSNGSGPTSFT